MSRSESGRIAATFIVRLWTEHGPGQAPQWRGQVEHVQSGEQAYFRNLDHMLDFIVGQRGDGEEEWEFGSDEQMSADDLEG
jgi:hypothetical protein